MEVTTLTHKEENKEEVTPQQNKEEEVTPLKPAVKEEEEDTIDINEDDISSIMENPWIDFPVKCRTKKTFSTVSSSGPVVG